MSNDNFSNEYLAKREADKKARMEEMIFQLEQVSARQTPQGVPGAPAVAAPAQAQTAPAKAPAKDNGPGFFSEGIKAVGGGIVDAGREVVNTLDDAATWLDNHFLDLRVGSDSFGTVGGRASAGKPLHTEQLQVPELPDWAQNKTTGGQVARSITQFLTPFLGTLKMLKAARPALGPWKSAAAAGVATDFAAFDPHEARLSNLILDLTDKNPAVGKAVFEYLASQPGDSNMEGRFKQSLEGLGLGLALEGLFVGLRSLRGYYKAKGKDALEEIVKANEARQAAKQQTDPAPAAAAPAPSGDAAIVAKATKEPTVSLQRHIELVTGVDRREVAGGNVKRRADAVAAFRPTPDELAETIAARRGAADTKLASPTRKDGVTDYVKPEKPAVDSAAALDAAETAAEAGTAPARKVLIDKGEIVIASDVAPSATARSLDDMVKVAIEKAPAERTPAEEAALRAYRDLQEKAMPDVAVPGTSAAPTPKATVVDEAAQAPAAKAEAAPAKPAKEIAEGDTVTYNGGEASGEVLKVGKHGKVAVLDDATGATKWVVPDAADPLAASIKETNRKVRSRSKRKAKGSKQLGYASSHILVDLASAGIGGVVGLNSADDDADFAEKLSLTLGGALAGLGIKVAGSKLVTKVLTRAERKAILNTPPVVRSLANPEVRNIAPTIVPDKKPPVIAKAKVQEIVDAAVSGGYRNLAEAVKKSDFNFDYIDSPEDVKELIDAFSQVFEKETKLAKHGKQSFEQIKELADELGAGVESMRAIYGNTDHLAARLLAHRGLLVASAERVSKLAKMANGSMPLPQGLRTEEIILAMRKQVAVHAAMQAQMKGIQTEVARALAQFRIKAASVDLAEVEITQLIDSLGGYKANMKFASELAAITDPKKANELVRRGAMARTKNAITEAIVLAKLWSPVTHVANAAGNLIVSIGSLAEREAAHLIGRFLRTGPVAVEHGEVKAQLFGMIGGLQDALSITADGFRAVGTAAGKAARLDLGGAAEALRSNADEFGSTWQALATGTPVGRGVVGTLDDAGAAAISSSNAGVDPRSLFGRAIDVFGTLTRIPGHALSAADDLFFAMHYRGEVRAQAYRAARGKGLEGQAFIDEVGKLIADPTPAMRADAIRAGQDGTFTSPLTGGQMAISKFLNESANIGPVPIGRIIVPFIRTPMNILNYVARRNPVTGLMAESYWADIRAGGAKADLANARLAVGSTVMTLAAVMATEMEVSGTKVRLHGGGDLRKGSEKLGGYQPYSLQIGDKFYAYNRLDPLGMLIGLAADARDIMGHIGQDEAEDLAAAALLSLGRNITSKSYVSGAIELIDALSKASADNIEPLNRYMRNQVAGFMPFSSALNTARKVDDPVQREVWTMWDAVRNKIPGLSKDLKPTLNLFGEEVVYKGGLGPDIASPITTSEVSSDPAAREIARLNIDLQNPPRTLGGVNGAPAFDLTPEQYHFYAKETGQMFKKLVTERISQPDWKDLPSDPTDSKYVDAKEKTIKMLHAAAKRYGYGRLLEADSSFLQMVQKNAQNAGAALTGGEKVPLQ